MSEFSYDVFADYVEMIRTAPPRPPKLALFPWTINYLTRTGFCTEEQLEDWGFELVREFPSASTGPECPT
jgi:hypothetical protein